MAKSKKYYTVWLGREKGVFSSWEACKKNIDGYPGAIYKSFKTEKEAQEALLQNPDKYFTPKEKKKSSPIDRTGYESITHDAICVDAACSGNPGKMEYRGIDLITKKEIFHQGPYEDATNNIGEFLALVHAIAWLEKRNMHRTIFSDSRIAIGWVYKKQVNTKLKKTKKNKELFALINRALIYLEKLDTSPNIVKWNTQEWGEIPADFGRK